MIEFNDKTYRSVEEMPPEVRKAYEEAMRHLAEAREKGLTALTKATQEESGLHRKVEIHTTKIVVNGQEYASMEEMPPEVRKIYEQAMKLAGVSLTEPAGQNVEGQAEPALSASPPETSQPRTAPGAVKEEPSLRLAPLLMVLGLIALILGFVLVMGLLR